MLKKTPSLHRMLNFPMEGVVSTCCVHHLQNER